MMFDNKHSHHPETGNQLGEEGEKAMSQDEWRL
jgi:hypothetical protein